MSPLMFLSLIFLLTPVPCSAHHIIHINSSAEFQFSSLAWDPTTRHFVVGSISAPNVYAVPDVGTVKLLVSEPSSHVNGISVTAVAIDHIRHRLIVVFTNHSSSVVAYDLTSYERIFTIPLPELDGDLASGVAVDLESGDVFVSGSRRGVVLKVGSEGDKRKVVSEFKVSDDGGLSGVVHI